MLFWIWPIILIAGLIVNWYYHRKYALYDPILSALTIALLIFGSVGTIVGGIALLEEHTCIDDKIADMEAEYTSLIIQYESDSYTNASDRYKLNLLEDIRDWNENLARKKTHQNSFCFGIYIPDIYDQFEFIEMK